MVHSKSWLKILKVGFLKWCLITDILKDCVTDPDDEEIDINKDTVQSSTPFIEKSHLMCLNVFCDHFTHEWQNWFCVMAR